MGFNLVFIWIIDNQIKNNLDLTEKKSISDWIEIIGDILLNQLSYKSRSDAFIREVI